MALRTAFLEALYACVRDDVLGPALFRLGLLLPEDVEDARGDVLCELFVRAVALCEEGRVETSRTPGEVRAFFRATTRNLLKDAARKVRRRVKSRPLSLILDIATQDDPTIRAALREEFEQLLQRLAPKDAQIILLRTIDGLSYAKIAEITGSTPAAARVRYSRARQSLRRMTES